MLDWRGTEIMVGSRVLYPATHGRSAMLVEGTVTRLHEDGLRLWVHRERTTGWSADHPVNLNFSYAADDAKDKPVLLTYGFKATVIG